MDKVYSRQEARDWFIENHSGSVICVSVVDRSEKVANCFLIANRFYKQNALLSKYRTETTLSVKEFAELQKECNELDIPINKIAMDIFKKAAKIIDKRSGKNVFPQGGKTRIYYDRNITEKNLAIVLEMFHKSMKDMPNYDENDIFYCTIDIHKTGLLGFFFKDVTDDCVTLVEIWDKKYLSTPRLLRNFI